MGYGFDELDDLQIELCYWLGFYKNIYEMDFEVRPTSDVVEDDAELDIYLEDLMQRQRRQRHKARHG